MATGREQIYAAITGDVAGSARCGPERLRDVLAGVLARAERFLAGAEAMVGRFAVYRGDSFQGIASWPELALPVGLLIRCSLISLGPVGDSSRTLDARIAIGFGGISHLPDPVEPGLSAGEALELSGPALDAMKRGRMLEAASPLAEVNKELEVHCRLLDALAGRWSPEQAEVLAMHIEGLDRKSMAERLTVSTQAVGQRLRLAGQRAIDATRRRWAELLGISHTNDGKG
ncbi:MAG: hypothetical protein ACP5HU_11630 [Phycisphaerae bacterium]